MKLLSLTLLSLPCLPLTWLITFYARNISPVSHVFLSFLAFTICSKDREVDQEGEFPTIDAKNNTEEVEEPTENTGETKNIVKGYMYQGLERGWGGGKVSYWRRKFGFTTLDFG